MTANIKTGREEKKICSKGVKLLERNYLIYLKEVPTQIAAGREVLRTTIRAFINFIPLKIGRR